MTCGCTTMKKKQKDCREPGNQGRMRKWLGHHQETCPKWPDWEEASRMEESEWRLEPEGEAEVPEVIIVSDAMGGTFVDWMVNAAVSR